MNYPLAELRWFFVGLTTLLFFVGGLANNQAAYAQTKVVVIPLSGGATGNATAADVVKGKTFSSSAGKGLTGTLERHPMGQTFVTPWYLLTFNLLPAGTFTMGSPVDEPGKQSDEGPQVETTISRPFYMMVNEMTQWQWGAVIDAAVFWGGLSPGELDRDPSDYKGADLPVTNVSYENIGKWIEVLNLLDGRSNCSGTLHEPCYRLPTEAEWEYAARAGTTNAYANPYLFDANVTETGFGFNSNLAAMGWYVWNDTNGGYLTGPKPVVKKQPNAWGLYDMHGNVWEWCRDWYLYNYYADPGRPATDPEGPTIGTDRVIRGGCWGNYWAWHARSANRARSTPGTRSDNLGFRLVLPPGQ